MLTGPAELMLSFKVTCERELMVTPGSPVEVVVMVLPDGILIGPLLIICRLPESILFETVNPAPPPGSGTPLAIDPDVILPLVI